MAQPIYDVLVVGTGIIGAAVALHLADQGLAVVCTGQNAATPGTASSAAGAMLGVLGEVTADAHSPLDQDELHLRHHGARTWPTLADRIGELTGARPAIGLGTAVIATAGNPTDRANLTAIHTAAKTLGLRCEPVDPTTVTYLDPAPGHETAHALWLADEGYLDTSTVLPAIGQALAAHPRIRHIPHLVVQVTHDERRATGAVLADGTRVTAGQVILAAGTATQPLLDQLGPRTGVTTHLLPGKGTSFTLHDPHHRPAGVIRTPNREYACGTHLIPRADGTLYLGATNRIADTPAAGGHPTPGELHALIHSALHEISTRLRTVAFTATAYGMRPLSSDGRPLIGSTDLPGLYLASGTYRNGVLLAPVIAAILTEAICATTTSTPLACATAFAPTAAWRTGAPDIGAVLASGVPHLVPLLLGPTGHLPYDRQRQLQTALGTLFQLAFTDQPGTDLADLRERCTRLLAGAHVPEVVPRVFYEIAATTDGSPLPS